MDYIGFEKPLFELDAKIDELKRLAITQAINLDADIQTLEKKSRRLREEIFSKLNAYETTQLARHPLRPRSLEIINDICSTFIELHGDRNFLDDKSIVGGLAQIDGTAVMIIGQQKGRGTKDNIFRNFGMPRPEGYRKALRLMSMAERFFLPIVTFIDTPGAYPGVGAEERGQAEAIAKNIMVMARLQTPIISIVIGEGGSGGALALAVANKVHMLQYSVYSVISPEGCASILMKDAGKAAEAAESLKLTAAHAKHLKIVDSIIKEPFGGAHRNPKEMSESIKKVILEDLAELKKMKREKLRFHRIAKFRSIGEVVRV